MPQPAPEIEELVRDWLAAKQGAQRDAIARCLSSYDGALAIGTDADEWWSGGDFGAAHLSGGPFEAVLDSVEAHRQGDVAWAGVRGVISTGRPEGFPVRLSLVLVLDDRAWRIVQSHASTPARD